ncbi:hypothetical protein [Nocardiopsis sp. LOL_012]|uniref:hypothetical protein n=1 Tax=Nocardiopsis sp. LOL_012 TaxID=3345409 RepID=UPI003A86B602
MTATRTALQRRHRTPTRCPRSCTEYLNARYGIRPPRPGALFQDGPVKAAETTLQEHGIPLHGPPDREFRELAFLVRVYLTQQPN